MNNETTKHEKNYLPIDKPTVVKTSTISQFCNILCFLKRKDPKKILNFNFPEFWTHVDVKINKQRYTVMQMICPKFNTNQYFAVGGSQNSGVYSVKNFHGMELIIKFPKNKAEYYRELKIYEDLKFSKYIINLCATEIKFKNKYFAAFVTPKVSLRKYSKDAIEFKMQYEHFKLLIKDLVKANYFLGDVRISNFGFDVQENVWKIFDIGIAFKIPQTQMEFDEIWKHFTKENIRHLTAEAFQQSVKFALKYPTLAAYRFNIQNDRFSVNNDIHCGLPTNICGYLSLESDFSEKWHQDFRDKKIFLSKEIIEMKYILSMKKSLEKETKDD
jgi:hypothetical protein